VNADNKALHRTTIPLRSKIAGELGRYIKKTRIENLHHRTEGDRTP